MMRLRTGLKLVAAREVAATRAAPPATMVTPDTKDWEIRYRYSFSYNHLLCSCSCNFVMVTILKA